MTVVAVQLDATVAALNRKLRSHGGGIAVERWDDTGALTVSFTGMCCGCPWKPLTWRGTVEAALLGVPGVTAVSAAGTRISDEAAARLPRALGVAASDRARGVSAMSSE